jgi:hypothetical protein
MLSQATMVVCSATKGGTWEGAKEDLKQGWVPLLVSTHAEPLQSGNKALLAGEGVTKPLIESKPVSIDTIDDVITNHQESKATVAEQSKQEVTKTEVIIQKDANTTSQQNNAPQGDLFASSYDDSNTSVNAQKIAAASSEPKSVTRIIEVQQNKEPSNPTHLAPDKDLESMPLLSNFYELLLKLIDNSDNNVISEETISESFPEFEIISKTALPKWLKHLTEIGLLERPDSRKKEYALPKSKNDAN